MALINCPECNKDVSEKADSCPNCGYPIRNEVIEKNIQVDNTSPDEQVDSSSLLEYANKNRVIAAIVGVSMVVVLILIFVISSLSSLSENDKKAFDMILKASDEFKDPSSVRLVSGSFSEDGTLCCVISATNGFGARVTSYYRIYESGFSYKTEYPDSSFKKTDFFNIEKINNKLKKEFSSYD